MLTGPADVVEPFAARARRARSRRSSAPRSSRWTSTPRPRCAPRRTLDRRRRATGQGGQGRRVLLGGQHGRRDGRRDAGHGPHQGRAASGDRDGPADGRTAVRAARRRRQRRLQAGAPAAVRSHGRGVRDGRPRRDRAAGRAAQHRRGADQGLAARAGRTRADGRARPALHRQRRGPRRAGGGLGRHRDRRLHRQRGSEAPRGHEQDPSRPGQGRDHLDARSTLRRLRCSSRR